jgi:hypothetical protein
VKIIDSKGQFDDRVLREGARLLQHQQASAGAQIHNVRRQGRLAGGERDVRSAGALNARVFPLLPGHLPVIQSLNHPNHSQAACRTGTLPSAGFQWDIASALRSCMDTIGMRAPDEKGWGVIIGFQ